MKIKKKKKQNSNGDDDNDEGIVAIKCTLNSILRKEYRDLMISAITERSLTATKICALGSLLFLTKVQRAFEENHNAFFEQNDGEDKIRKCFQAVLQHNIRSSMMDPEFRQFVSNLPEEYRFDWPKTDYLGNGLNYLIITYVTNVENNLNTHLKKRLYEFLKMKVFLNNNRNPFVRFDKIDIYNTIQWVVFGKDRTEYGTIEGVERREKRELLLNMIRHHSWFEIENDNITNFTKENWFKSLPMWLGMQREIEEFNVTEENRQQRREQALKQKQSKQTEQKTEPDSNTPPKIKNLAVIPICSFFRTHFTIDNFNLYKLFCGAGLMPKNENGRQISSSDFRTDKSWYWNQVFKLPKIKQLGRKWKQFRFMILSDGASVSILYTKQPHDSKPMEESEIIRKYLNGDFVYELGIDPGMKTWNATVRRTIDTGKEVSKKYN